MSGNITAALVGIGVLGVLAQWLAWRLKLPAILFLLGAGVVAGPAIGWLNPDALFGELLFPVISLAVAVILFEGALTLRLDELRGLEHTVRRLLTEGVAITWAATTVATHYLIGLDWPLALLFGAITVVTGPTVIQPLLRTVRPNAQIARALRWEGIIIDPIGALLAVLVFEFLISRGEATGIPASVLIFATILAVGSALGAAAGYLLGVVLRRHWLPEYLHAVGTLITVFAVFHAANLIHHESGLLAVTVMGMWLGNMRGVPLDEILNFKESLSLLLISGLFVILAARLEPAQLLALGGGAAALVAFFQLVSRPLSVLVCTRGSGLTWRERSLLAWIAPRGIVAAAVSALFALRLAEAGYEGAEMLVPLTFLIIIATVVIQSATARPIARLLGVTEPPPRGVLIVGANNVGRAIGQALKGLEFPVLLADANWDNINAARMEGLPVYYGNPTSEHAERHLELTGLGRLMAVSPRSDLNTLACLHFAKEFGQQNVFRLPPGERDLRLPTEVRRRHRKDNTLFGDDATYAKLASTLAQGGSVKATRLTEQFGYDDYLQRRDAAATPLFALDPRGRIRIFDGDSDPEPGPGWTVVALVPNGAQRDGNGE
jgi:CPA1 family monovalent cation:H+ antiporter